MLKKGDYVLASKWHDGDTKDHWAIGFFCGMLRDRFLVADEQGTLFRANGFRRAEKITPARGESILKIKNYIESGAASIWWWKRTSLENLSINNTPNR